MIETTFNIKNTDIADLFTKDLIEPLTNLPNIISLFILLNLSFFYISIYIAFYFRG